MEKENEGEDVVVDDLPGAPEAGKKDATDWKAVAEKNHGIATRLKTKLDKQKAAKEAAGDPGKKDNGGKDPADPSAKKGELDRMDKAILRMEKITDSKEIELVQSVMKDTGKDLESVLGMKYFQAELKEMRELAKTEEATPQGSKRSGTSTRDTVDYWLAKGDLPPLDQPELRRKVVNAKIAKQKAGSQFSANPIQ